MAALTIQTVAASGLAPAYTAAAAGGDSIANDYQRNTIAHVKNGGGASINVTVAPYITSKTVPDVGVITVPNIVVAVPAGSDRMIGPFPANYTDANGNVNLAYSAVTSVTVAAIKVPDSV